ncbi:hypothetical protein R1sor_019767 [Riccia sorocarpa]|uniref:Uncharacterized protein n=1 Tax=Riccia sorocarpa TaxID=122646 RepID=A0ABD3IDG0_9MARC
MYSAVSLDPVRREGSEEGTCAILPVVSPDLLSPLTPAVSHSSPGNSRRDIGLRTVPVWGCALRALLAISTLTAAQPNSHLLNKPVGFDSFAFFYMESRFWYRYPRLRAS